MQTFNYLPEHIAESDVLSLSAKKVLDALLNRLIHSKAKETKVICVGWKKLRKEAGVGSEKLSQAIMLLEDYNLISVEKAEWVTGEKDNSAKYTINFEQLIKPVEKKNFMELYSQFLPSTKSPETSISNTITITNKIKTIPTIISKSTTKDTMTTKVTDTNKTKEQNYNKNHTYNPEEKIKLEINQYTTSEDRETYAMLYENNPDKYEIIYTKTPVVDFGFKIGEGKETKYDETQQSEKSKLTGPEREVENFKKLEERYKLDEGYREWMKSLVPTPVEEEGEDGLPF